LNYDFIEYDILTLTEIKLNLKESEPFDYALDPTNGVNVGTETSFFWGLPPAYV
jgi:hypothetical protein